MDPKLIMAIDIVDVLRTLAADEEIERRNILLHAATHIENLREIADERGRPARFVPAPERAPFDPDSYKVEEE